MGALNDLIPVLTKVAPVLGGALGGPLGAAVVNILAEVFNTAATPDAVGAAINSSDPEVVKANLARAEAAFKAAAEEAATQREQINATVEMAKLDFGRGVFFSGWRPLAGWAATLYAAALGVLVVFQAYSNNYGLIGHAVEALMINGPLMALAGVIAWQRSEERKAMINNPVGDLLKSIMPNRS